MTNGDRQRELDAAYRALRVFKAGAARRLMELDVSPHIKPDDWPLIVWAALSGSPDDCSAVLDRGGYVDAFDDSRSTPLSIAAAQGNLAVVRILVERGASLRMSATHGCDEALHEAVRKSRIDIVEYLLKAGASVNASNAWNETPLYIAACSGNSDLCRTLIGMGADVNALVSNGGTALHNAAVYDQVSVCRLLVSLGADPFVLSRTAPTNVHQARARRLLTSIGASSAFTDKLAAMKPELTPFHVAVQHGALAVAQYFITECGADPAQRAPTGRTLLQLASKHPQMKELILSMRTQLAVQNVADRQAGNCTTLARRASQSGPL